MGESTGRLVVLEGVDDVGKSTVASTLATKISKSRPANVLAFPGNEPGSVGKWVYDLHHDPERQSINQTSLQLLHVAAQIDCIESQVKPLIKGGRDVILDRYWWSTYVYGVVGGVEVSRLEKMIDLEIEVWGNCQPDCIVLLRREAAEQQGLRIKCGVVKDMEEVLRIEGTFHSLALGTAFDGGVLAQHADD